MSSYYRNVYEVTGYTYDGAAYCIDHRPEGVEPPDILPIFLGDEWEHAPTCDECHEPIDCTVLTQRTEG